MGKRGAAKKDTKPQTVAAYLAGLSEPQRRALEKIRAAIASAAPDAQECISYGIPAYRLGEGLLVAFGAAKNHCAFYPGAEPMRVHMADLKGYDVGKGTIRFKTEKPLPATLVRKLVKARIAQARSRASS